ncbi:hypothetical protein [Caulobacter sp. FWC26]|uniref:hypothetical protein n=2 Tax=unclassified Caulobacter TaxID=2648921 RepID=UPI000C15712E|nr:hypothetical protein [Caulobacter sp. FWC26]AZS20727.1 hypothetical protein CSW63_08755 [Caulobacter sp. FWC26]
MVPDTTITPPDRKRLAIIVASATAIAAILFVGVVLPAEFGKDPIGVGKLTGLSKLAAPKEEVVTTAPADQSVARYTTTAYRSDVIDIPLNTADAGRGGEELEYKVRMKTGDSLVYSWSVDGVTVPEEFYSDFHGESPPSPKVKVIEYRQATGTSSSGSLIAPMDGIHGWYLQNQSAKAVVVKLRISGFYQLVPPGEPGNKAKILPKASS